MQPCKLIMTTASNTANLQFLGITKASGHGHINYITLYFTVQILNLLVFIVGALVGKKTQLKFLQKFINCPKRWCIFFFRKGSIEFPKQMQIIIHVLFATHIKLEKWKKKGLFNFSCECSVARLPWVNLSGLHESTFKLCVLTGLNEWWCLVQTIVNNEILWQR